MKSKQCKCCLQGTGTWLVLIAVALGLGLGFSNVTFEGDQSTLRPTDMRLIAKDLPKLLCSGVTVSGSSYDDDVAVFLLPHPPGIDPEPRQIYSAQEADTVGDHYYKTWTYYLLEGSVVKLNSACDTQLEMYVYQGQTNYNKFINNEDCDKCYVHHETFQGNSSYELITGTDDYYFVYVNRNWQKSEELIVDFSLNRTLYDVGNVLPCIDNWCHFDFQIGSEESIVVQQRPSPKTTPSEWSYSRRYSDTTYSTSVYVSCNPRVWMYVMLFGLVPLTLGSLATALLCLRCRKSRVVDTSDQHPLLNTILEDECDVADEETDYNIPNTEKGDPTFCENITPSKM